MNNDYRKQLGSVGKLALDGHLVEALSRLADVSRNLGDWEVTSAVEKLQDTYNAMLRFMAEGMADTASSDVVDSITSETLALTMRLSRRMAMELGSEIYFSTARSVLCHKEESISKLVKEYSDELNRLDEDYESLTNPRRTERAEQILRDIFNRVWVTHPLSADDFTAVNELVSPAFPRHARALVISAVALGHLNYYDTKRLAWLFSRYVEYHASEPSLALRALVEAMVCMLRYRRRPVSKTVRDVIESARELPEWDKDFASVAIELMRAVRTEDISAKMKDGFLNNLNDLDAELREKIKGGEIDLESLAAEMNPEWADEINHSNLGKSLREMAEIQAEGGDVFMLSFSQMKRFPFFHDLSNWYLPFYESHSAVVAADNDEGVISSLLAKMPVLCDSDKYSLILSLTSIPATQRDQLAAALKMQAEQMAEQLSEVDKASGEGWRRSFVNKYVQNIYRTVNLFRSKADLFNPFTIDGLPDILQIKALEGNPGDPLLYETIAQFYFKNHHWMPAIKAFDYLDKTQLPDGRRAQQKGYAYEKIGELTKALESYEEAEMLSGESEWILRRLAKTLSRTYNFERASFYYKKLSELYPDDSKIALDYADVLMDLKETEKAEQEYHKAVYLVPDSPQALRGLAWAQFMNRKFDRSAETYDRIISLGGERDDYMRYAFVKWGQKDFQQSITLLRLAMQDNPDSLKSLDFEIYRYRDELARAGIDYKFGSLLAESVRYLSRQS